MKNPTLSVLLFAVAFLAIVWWPVAIIWSVNTLFNTEIPVNFRTWIAVVLLVSILKISISGYSKKD
jgi:hypothetical protein